MGPLRICRRNDSNVVKVGNSYKKKSSTTHWIRIFALMFPMRPIIALFALVMFVTATVGLPVTIHYCGGEAVATRCPPDECCSEQVPEEASQEEPCCTDEVSVASIDSQVVVTQNVQIAPLLWVIHVILWQHATNLGDCHTLPASDVAQHPYPPPDLAQLCVFRV